MNNSIQDEQVREILRPTLFRGSKTALFYFLLFVVAIYVTIEFVFLKELWTASISQFLICWIAPLILIIIWSLVSRFSSSMCVCDTKLIIKDYSPDSFLRVPFQLLQIPLRQEIFFKEIDCIFYLEKEYNLLLNYRDRLEKYRIARREMDYRRGHLVQKYGVPTQVIDAFERSSGKALNDYTATGVIMAVEEILDRYKIQKDEKKKIIKELKKTDDFDFAHVAGLLSPHAIAKSDLDNLKDTFSDLDTDALTPFLTTRLAVASLEWQESRRRGGAGLAARINAVVVLSNQDGSKKVYLKRFHSLSRADWQKLIHIINKKKPGIRYLMSRQSYRNISDPDFRPGRG